MQTPRRSIEKQEGPLHTPDVMHVFTAGLMYQFALFNEASSFFLHCMNLDIGYKYKWSLVPDPGFFLIPHLIPIGVVFLSSIIAAEPLRAAVTF